MKIFALIASVAFLIVTLALAQAPPSRASATASGVDPAFAKFVDDYFDSRFASRPMEGTSAGFHQ
jgi:hypothetical protein